MKQDFFVRAKEYFGDRYDEFVSLIDKDAKHGLVLNTAKAGESEILDIIDFDIERSGLCNDAYFHSCSSIGKTKAYELGLIYPQDVESAMPVSMFKDSCGRIILDLCSAPGGKSIDMLNKCHKEGNDDVLLIANDISYKRATILSSNFERLGLGNTIVTCKDTEDFTKYLYERCDTVILDAPCSGEGMIRKYPEILDDYSVEKIQELAALQSKLLDVAYQCLKPGGQLLYSTCTFAKEEDEYQVQSFLDRYEDMILDDIGDAHSSSLPGTVKLSFLDGTEGQYMAIMHKKGKDTRRSIKCLRPCRNALVEKFVADNLTVDKYYLYSDGDKYYLSLTELPDLGKNVLRTGIYAGEIVNKRFEPSHAFYRANQLKPFYRFVYELNDDEYERFVSGQELFSESVGSHYYCVCYKNCSLGYGKGVNGTLKNKYPKGLRRMI